MKIKGMLLAILAHSTLVSASDYSSWSSYREITINPATAGGITAAETHYPLLLRLTTPGGSGAGSFNFSQAMANGNDIRFTASDGVTDLPYEIERWDSANGTAHVWVKVNSLSGSANTVIRMYWGKAGAAAVTNGSSVFNSTTNNFKAVFHFNNSTGSSTDVPLTPVNNGTSDFATSSALIGGHVRNFNSSTSNTGTNTANYVDLGASSADTGFMNSSSNTTLGAWIYTTTFATGSGSYGTIIAHGAGDNAEHFLRTTRNTSTSTYWTAGIWNGTDYRNDFSVTNTAEAGNWHYIVGTYALDASGGTITLYRDGVAVGTPSSVSSAFTASVQNWVMGRYGANTTGRYFQGWLEEARLAGKVLDASWIKWDFETQKANQTCVTFGTAQSPVGVPSLVYSLNPAVYTLNTAITNNTPMVTGSVDSFTVNPALPVGLSLNKTSGVISGTPTTPTAMASYMVTARNSAGTATVSLGITVLAPPSNLSYLANPVVYTVGTEIGNNSPTVTGSVDSFTVNPALPVGLSLNKTSGVISGTPTTPTAMASYMVTARNNAGITTISLSITVNNVVGIMASALASSFQARTVGFSVEFRLPVSSISGERISVMDLWGRTVWSQSVATGITQVWWDGIGSNGLRMNPGLYLVQMRGVGLLGHSIMIQRKITYTP